MDCQYSNHHYFFELSELVAYRLCMFDTEMFVLARLILTLSHSSVSIIGFLSFGEYAPTAKESPSLIKLY